MKFDHRSTTAVQSGVIRQLPADLVAAVVYALSVSVLLVVIQTPWLRLGLVLPLFFFVPGYSLVACLYPEAPPANDTGSARSFLSLPERAVLSFGLSLVVVPLIGIGLWQVGEGSMAMTFAMVLTLFVLATSSIGMYRRLSLPPSRQFQLPYDDLRQEIHRGFDPQVPTLDRAINGLLVLSVLLAAAALGYGLVHPMEGESYTSVALLSENEAGELVATGYPSSFTAGSDRTLAIELTNHEGSAQTYTIVARLERVRTEGGEPTVVQSAVVDQFSQRVSAGENDVIRHSVAPTMVGEDLRLSYYVYKGGQPEEVGADTAYRHTYIWISVE